MQLYIIDWSFQNAEDQLYATNEFCECLQKGKFDEYVEGFELLFIAHTPQNGSGVIICKAQEIKLVYKILKMWRDNYSVSFNIKPALSNEELLKSHSERDFWSKE